MTNLGRWKNYDWKPSSVLYLSLNSLKSFPLLLQQSKNWPTMIHRVPIFERPICSGALGFMTLPYLSVTGDFRPYFDPDSNIIYSDRNGGKKESTNSNKSSEQNEGLLGWRCPWQFVGWQTVGYFNLFGYAHAAMKSNILPPHFLLLLADHCRIILGSSPHCKWRFSCFQRFFSEILECHFSWQAQYLVRLEGDTCCSAHCKWGFICDED